MRIFDLSLRFNGYPIHKARQELGRIQNISETGYGQYLDKRKQQIVEYHLKNNSFYRELNNGNDFVSWDRLPVLTKRHLQRPLRERLSDGFTESSVYVNKTSGSSGDPFIFAKDKWCHAITWALIMDRFSWYDIDFNSSWQARFYGIPLERKGYLKERLKDWLSRRVRFSVFDMSEEAFESCLKSLKRKPFEYINGYTSAIVQFAKFLRKKGIRLNTVCPQLKACMVTSEMLFPDDRRLLEDQFGIPVINEYGASELDLIAFENPRGDWQLNSETLFVEILDENNESLPKGEQGRVVITSLYNKAHPFIRYDIGDTAILSEEGNLKLPILKSLEGRTNDLVILPSGKRAAGLTFYYITKQIIEDDGNVKEFIIEQTHLDCFRILYVSENAISEDKKTRIKAEMVKYLESGIKVTFERKAEIERSKSGKLKQFTSLLNQ